MNSNGEVDRKPKVESKEQHMVTSNKSVNNGGAESSATSQSEGMEKLTHTTELVHLLYLNLTLVPSSQPNGGIDLNLEPQEEDQNQLEDPINESDLDLSVNTHHFSRHLLTMFV